VSEEAYGTRHTGKLVQVRGAAPTGRCLISHTPSFADWLDNGNNKKAFQEAERVLKKQPDLQCAKVLKALAMQRMGQTAEAEDLLDKILAERPTKDDVLSAMAIAFKELNRAEKVCAMYENAVAVEPKNEELLSQLFMSYVRTGKYKKQQTAAMQLYKAAPKNPYYFWAVMSLVLQAESADDKVATGVVLPLAERMIKKLEAEGKIEQEQEMHLYLLVLEMQDKFEEALAVIDGPLGKKLLEKSSYLNFVSWKRLVYLTNIKAWSKVYLLCKQFLREE